MVLEAGNQEMKKILQFIINGKMNYVLKERIKWFSLSHNSGLSIDYIKFLSKLRDILKRIEGMNKKRKK